jgi:ADP-ribose pyrophosphatase
MREKTIKTQRFFKGRLLGLRKDTVKLSSGKITTREIVEHPGAAAVLAITPDKKLLLVKQFRKPVEKIVLEIPAGVHHRKEVPCKTAKRELEEETGYRAQKLKRLASAYISPGYSTEIIHYVLAQKLTKTKPSPEEDENIKVVKVPLKKCWHLIETGKIKDNKTIVGILLLLQLSNRVAGSLGPTRKRNGAKAPSTQRI